MTHHIDDGRIIGSTEPATKFIAHLQKYVLLKMSDKIIAGGAVKHLGRVKVRMPNGWCTIPDARHLDNVFQQVGYGKDKIPGRKVATPGVKRDGTEFEEQPVAPELASPNRSATGSLIYYSQDVEVLSYGVKELARSLQTPTEGSWMDLKRMARWLWDHQDIVIFNIVDKDLVTDPVRLVIQQDSDWAGSGRDRKSTTGLRGTVANFRVSHAAQTQPGLPSLSSAEAELRSLTRACCEAVYVKRMLSELNLEVDILLQGDASAAYRNADKLGPGKVKHLETSAYYIKEAIRKKVVRTEKIPREINYADMHTHHLSTKDFENMLVVTGVKTLADVPPYHLCEIRPVNSFKDIVFWKQTSGVLKPPPYGPVEHVDVRAESVAVQGT